VQPPVAERATELGIPTFQPPRLRAHEAVERVAAEHPEAIVVAAYGQILARSVLELPPFGCLNLHPSLLPRHRGAAPISGAILAGDPVTGATIMLMDEGMDTGPILAQRETPIADDDDQLSLTERLARLGAELMVDTLARHAAGTITPQPQEAALATVTRRVMVADGALDWTEPADTLWRRIRAYAEWPQGQTSWNGRQLRILRAAHDSALDLEPGLVAAYGPPRRSPQAVAIGTGRGVLLPEVIGVEGRRPMPIADFLRGAPSLIGSTLATVTAE
jgi:methionyl-tRNA formyltransferase